MGAMKHLDLTTGPRMVIDLGGGSTELVLGEGAEVALRTSLEIGSVRLTEAFMKDEVYTPTDLSSMKNQDR